MLYISYLIKIICYLAIVFLGYLYLKYRPNKKKNLIIIAIFLLAFGFYGVICGPEPEIADRLNYGVRYENINRYTKYIKNDSLGLFYLESFLHIFSNSREFLYFSMPVIYLALSMYALKLYNNSKPLAVLFIGLSIYGLYGFYAYKQCIAMALIAISFALFNQKRYIKSLIFLALAVLFHEVSWIALPIYFICLFANKKKDNTLLYIIIIVMSLSFLEFSKPLFSLFTKIPGLEAQIQKNNYLSETGNIVNEKNIFTIIKGLPFYFIFLFAYVKRKKLKDKINNFNSYLFLTLFASISSMLSYYMYWMWRFGALFYFPIFIFGSNLYYAIENKKEKKSFFIVLFLTLMVLQVKLLLQYYFKYGGII